MAYAELHQPRFLIAERAARLAEGVRNWRAKRAEYDRVYAELSMLTDRDLNDIGVSRVQIHDIARQASNAI